MGHIFEVVDHTGNKTAAQVTSHKAAEAAQQKVHEPDLVGDFSDNGLLAMWAHSLHRGSLEDFSLQDGDCSGGGGCTGAGWHNDCSAMCTR